MRHTFIPENTTAQYRLRKDRALRLNEEAFAKLSFNFNPVQTLSLDKMEDIIDFGIAKEAFDNRNNEHEGDNRKVAYRYANGAGGELAMEQQFNLKFANLNVGHRGSNEFRGADLKTAGFKIGVKVFTEPWLPLIYPEDMLYPQLFVYGEQKLYDYKLNGNIVCDTYTLVGLGTVEVLTSDANTDTDYVGLSSIYNTGKTVFIALDQTIQVYTTEDLIKFGGKIRTNHM